MHFLRSIGRGSVCALFIGSVTFAQYSGGTGTGGDPYQIASSADLLTLANTSADWDKEFLQTAHINLTAVTLGIIGNGSTPFVGVYDGGGFTISNLSHDPITIPDVGLFGVVEGQIFNVHLIDPVINGTDTVHSDNYGALVGTLRLGSVRDCSVRGGSVTGDDKVGGLIGVVERFTVERCSAQTTVTGISQVGGLVGRNENADVLESFFIGDVSGSSTVAGLVGAGVFSTIVNCFTQGSVRSSGLAAGIIAANDTGAIIECYSACQVSSSASGQAGGLIGSHDGTIGPPAEVEGSFWDAQISSTSSMCAAVGANGVGCDDQQGLTTAAMQSQSTFLASNWDLNFTWLVCEGAAYPRFVWEGLDCVQNLVHFAAFAVEFGRSDCTVENDWCNGADVNELGGVVVNDFRLWVANWLGLPAW